LSAILKYQAIYIIPVQSYMFGRIGGRRGILHGLTRFEAVYVGWAEIFGHTTVAGVFRLANSEHWVVYLRIGRIGSMLEKQHSRAYFGD
jgi:hypothetical protein